MESCTNCAVLKYQIEQLESAICTLEQEARQQHARNVRLTEELDYANKLIGELRETKSISYAEIKASFSR